MTVAGGRFGFMLWVGVAGVMFWVRAFGRGPFYARYRSRDVGETRSL